jgi:farnesyl diphosphate synthase
MPAAVEEEPPDLARRQQQVADLVTVALDALLPRADGPEQRLTEAMRYAALGPSRRLRPFLALEAARMWDLDERAVLRAACALECVHLYSLIHDDLPALDNDDERFGRPSLHRAYDEAVAILAGDALQAAAFEILAHPDTHEDPLVRAELVRRLAVAAGARGLAGGQTIDLLAPTDDLGATARMQRLKTGALMAFAFEIPLCLARAPEAERLALLGFAQDLGLAYQIVDDLTDEAADTDVLRRRSDVRAQGAGPNLPKVNFVSLFGREAAAERVGILATQCRKHLDIFGRRARYLRDCVDFVLGRHA